MIATNHVKRVHLIRAQTKPYVPYFIRKRPLVTVINSSPLGAISRVPQLSIIHSIFHVPPHQFCCLCCVKQMLQARNYREIPHHLRGRSFLMASLHHGIIASFVSWGMAPRTWIQVFVISVNQYAVIRTSMNFLYFKSQWADHLLGLVRVLRQLIQDWNKLLQQG